uniref:NADH dehydrogenase subunit 4 n=1 Tax=Odoiporus longicollis TaxID=354431 RepID=UPI0020015CCE|nr:NADH dehydrogenase subunit 4 [Odoiporus longicollis]UOL50373.1 NADH dehydrogenase subunit 4 [Odoiporus longicollis]
MMKFVGMLMFLIPMSFMVNYWLFIWMFMLVLFMYLLDIVMSCSYINLTNYMGEDLLSYTLILLSFWICFLMLIASEKLYTYNNFMYLYMMMVMVLMLSLFLTFSFMNVFMFYLFFEISLIPIFLLIIGWGYQPERISAGNYLLFYTLFMSLPMMLGLFYIYKTSGTLEFYFFMVLSNQLLYVCMNMVFFVKIPMFMFHLWLPKAHVEAPISGSMILAGVMLKLGGYGLMRVMKIFMFINKYMSVMFISISLVGGVIVSLICLRQSDIKSLIAYSSVAHMGMVLGGILTLNNLGMWGSLVLMLGHGLCSSGLFCLANISYERVGSRSIYLNKGMLNLFPSLSLWWFLLSACNMAAPPSLNLLGEILLINSLMIYSKYFMVFLSLISFFSAAYSLFLYSYTQHGKFYSGLYCMYSISVREFFLVFMHWIPLNFLVIKSELFSLWL